MNCDFPYYYVFIFWQPLPETSLPLAELQSVLRHLAPTTVVEVVHPDTLLDGKTPELPSQYIAVAPLRQSAIAASTHELDVANLVARSGYMHSGGPLVFARQWRKADATGIRKACRQYLMSHAAAGADLIWYQKMDEQNAPKELNSILIDESRYHLGERPFRPEAERIRAALRGQSNTPKILLYAYRDRARTKSDTKSVYLDYEERDTEDYLIIYKTDAKKENPIHNLDDVDECKPFWAGIFNTPHRLINALLNMADVGENSIVVDPFSYSGTVAIETAKLGGIAKSFDISEVRGAEDNFQFFCTVAGPETLQVAKRILSVPKKVHELLDLAIAHSGVNELNMPDVKEDGRIEQLMIQRSWRKQLSTSGGRMAYYLLRRYHMESRRKVRKVGSDPQKYVEKLVNRLESALQYMAALRKYQKDGLRLCVVPGQHVTSEHCIDQKHKTSRVFLSYAAGSPNNNRFRFKLHDITGMPLPLPDGSVDAVVSDPPYGYGDMIERDDLYRIYRAFFKQALRIIKNGGSLVFCALDKVRTGRAANNLFTTEEVVRMLHDEASQSRVDFAFPSIDPIAEQARGLYYWKSPKALNRSIFAARIYRRK